MYFQCLNEYGVNSVILAYETNEDLADGMSFKTGDLPLKPPTSKKCWCYSGTPVDGSTDGTLIENFKLKKANKVKEKSNSLVKSGASYNSKTFNVKSSDVAFITGLMVSINEGDDLTGQVYFSKEGSYLFANNVDVKGLFAAIKSRINYIYGGEITLLGQITAAANTQEAMDLITDSRA